MAVDILVHIIESRTCNIRISGHTLNLRWILKKGLGSFNITAVEQLVKPNILILELVKVDKKIALGGIGDNLFYLLQISIILGFQGLELLLCGKTVTLQTINMSLKALNLSVIHSAIPLCRNIFILTKFIFVIHIDNQWLLAIMVLGK